MATQKDVAREAGVAISTVSRTFTHPERLNAETADRVRRAAERLNYRANPLAKALITGTSPLVGLLVTDLADPFMSALVKGAQAEAQGHGLWLIVGDTEHSPDREQVWSDGAVALAGGLILAAPSGSDEALLALAQTTPVVLAQRTLSGVPSVSLETRLAHGALLDHLGELGHRRLVHLPGPADNRSGRERLRSLTDAAEERDLELTVLPHTDPGIDAGKHQVDAVIASGATAAFCFDDHLALGLMLGLHHRGVLVPDEISVIGHDDQLGGLTTTGITTTSRVAETLGRRAVRRLRMVDDETSADGDAEAETVQAEAIFRGSVGSALVRD